jgi:hypothetical protein
VLDDDAINDTSIDSAQTELASAGDIATAQADLDLLTGTDGAILATSQPNYAVSTFDATSDTVDVGAINGNATSAQQLARSAATIEFGTASGTPSTTVIPSNLTGLGSLVGRVLIVISGDQRGEATSITGYDSGTGDLTVTTMAAAIVSGDTFVVL